MEMAGPDVAGRMKQTCPLNRLGTIEEHASLVIYLATEEANYINGHIIATNRGIF